MKSEMSIISKREKAKSVCPLCYGVVRHLRRCPQNPFTHKKGKNQLESRYVRFSEDYEESSGDRAVVMERLIEESPL